jgi:5-methyltetrahydrofolate--homocysteine methyltransferase
VRMSDFVTTLRSGRVLLMDGAMGTELLRYTRSSRLECSADYNLAKRQLVRAIHQSYLDAGADVLLTNTFQANPAVLARRGWESSLHDVWQAAIGLPHLDHPRPRYVLADVGPVENLTLKTAAEILAECIDVDGVLLETWSSLGALRRFVDRPISLPLLVSFTFHRAKDFLTFDGVRPERCAREAQRLGAVAIGANCGKEIGMEDLREIVRRYRQACDLPIFIRPNAGTPTKNGWRYPRTPTTMAAALPALLDEGVTMLGGCCGTTPAHIRAFREVIDGYRRPAHT